MKTSAVTKVVGDEYNYFHLLSYFEIQQFNTTIQGNNSIQQHNTTGPSSTHTLQFDLGRVASVCREHFRGESSAADDLKSSRHYLT
jgi:hypothetical protein